MYNQTVNPKVLLCTTYQRFPGDYYDVAGRSIYSFIRLSTPRRASLGLRFIKQNVPEVLKTIKGCIKEGMNMFPN